MKTQVILDHLEKFMALRAVTKGGSIRKAAALLNISQPSLSVKMTNLEDLLGMKLLLRSRDGIALTPAGSKALEFVEKVSQNAEDLRIELEQSQNLKVLEGHIRIGLYDSIARYFWPPFYKSFAHKYPKIEMTVSTGRSHSIVESVSERDLDLGIVVSRAKPKDQVSIPLYKDTFSCFCSKSFAAQLKKSVNLSEHIVLNADISKVPLIFFCKAVVAQGETFDKYLGQGFTERFHTHPVENFEIARAFCEEGIGLAILPNQVAAKDFRRGIFHRVALSPTHPLHFGEHSIDIILKKSFKQLPVLKVALDEIQKFVEESKVDVEWLRRNQKFL